VLFVLLRFNRPFRLRGRQLSDRDFFSLHLDVFCAVLGVSSSQIKCDTELFLNELNRLLHIPALFLVQHHVDALDAALKLRRDCLKLCFDAACALRRRYYQTSWDLGSLFFFDIKSAVVDDDSFVLSYHGAYLAKTFAGIAEEFRHTCVKVFIVGEDFLLDDLVVVVHVHLDNVHFRMGFPVSTFLRVKLNIFVVVIIDFFVVHRAQKLLLLLT